MKNDLEVVLEYVKRDGRNLNLDSNKLKKDKEIVLESVKNNGYSLFFASKKLSGKMLRNHLIICNLLLKIF